MVKIEPISQSHLDLVHQYASDRRISETSNVPHPYTREMADDWFNMVLSRQELGRSQVFAIIYKGNFAGVISLNNISIESGKAEIDYWVAVKFQGKGVATSAVREAISYGHKSLGLKSFSSRLLNCSLGLINLTLSKRHPQISSRIIGTKTANLQLRNLSLRSRMDLRIGKVQSGGCWSSKKILYAIQNLRLIVTQKGSAHFVKSIIMNLSHSWVWPNIWLKTTPALSRLRVLAARYVLKGGLG